MTLGDPFDLPLLGGRYEQIAILGHGAQGVVIRARDRHLGRDVALKVRHIVESTDRDVLLDEARLLVAVPPHPNVAIVRDDFFEGDAHVLVMDFVDGPNLATRLDERGGGLDPRDVVRWLSDVAAALDHLHRQRPPVFHGDVKPANIVITAGDQRDGDRAVLVDFGLAAALGSRRRTGGTAAYAAPEVATTGPEPRGDVYSLAATAYALLTGLAPAPGGGAALPGGARDVLSAALATRPDARPSLAAALIDELAAALGLRPSPGVRPVRSRGRLRWVALAAVAALVAATAAYAASRPNANARGETVAAPAIDTSTSRVGVETTTGSGTTPGRRTATNPPGPAGAPPPQAAPATIARIGLFRSDGTLEVRRLAASGTLAEQRSGATGYDGWTHTVRVHDGFLFLYRGTDGANRTVTVGPDGDLTLGRVSPDIRPGWSHVVSMDRGLVFFYRASDGYASTRRYSDRRTLIDGDSYADSQVLLAGHDHVVHAGENRVLLYSSQTGRAAILTIDDQGILTISAQPTLPSGFSLLAPGPHDHVVSVRSHGTAEVFRVTSTSAQSAGVLSLGAGRWQRAIRVAHDGVLFHNADDGIGRLLHIDATGTASRLTEVATASGAGLTPID